MDNTKKIAEFNKISIYNRIDPFFEEDIQDYYENSAEFSLSLKCSSSEIALYGSRHVAIRQSFFNDLPVNDRIHLCIQKLRSANILNWVLDTLKITPDHITNVQDVGKGRSIYKCETTVGAVVIKEKSNNTQEVFNNLADIFAVPRPKSYFTHHQNNIWELTEFLNDKNVFKLKKNSLIPPYARAAAFGDFIEVGDRHFENYIANEHSAIAIDVAHLMEDDNQHWTRKYIAGGLYEICMIQYFMTNITSFETVLRTFFDSYEACAKWLFDKKNKIQSKILDGLGWVSAKQFLLHMQDIYVPAIHQMLDRLCYKALLKELNQKHVDLNQYPELKMYVLADENRISTFFRADELDLDVFKTIELLAAQHLGITAQYFKDHQHVLAQFKNALVKAHPIQSKR
jgi:hypothetical protein